MYCFRLLGTDGLYRNVRLSLSNRKSQAIPEFSDGQLEMLLVMNELSGRLTICILRSSLAAKTNQRFFFCFQTYSRTEISLSVLYYDKREKKMGVIRLLVQLGSIENDQICYFACSYFQRAQGSVNGEWKWEISVRLGSQAWSLKSAFRTEKPTRPRLSDMTFVDPSLKELKWPWNVSYWWTSVISLCNHSTTFFSSKFNQLHMIFDSRS